MDILRLGSRSWFGYPAAFALTAMVTGVVALVRSAADVSNVSMLYLLAVLVGAVAFGSGPAIAASIASFLAFDFFFIEPKYTFTVANEEEWVALGLLLTTGIITGQLAAALRDRARQAESREREAAVLYDVVRLMDESDLQRALAAVAQRLRQEMDLAAVVIDLERAAPVRVRAEAGDREALATARNAALAPGSILGTGQAPSETRRGSPGRWIRVVPPVVSASALIPRNRLLKVPINLQGQPAGALMLLGQSGGSPVRAEDDRLLSAVANQLGLALERVRLQEEATQAEVLRRTDELKTALLNAVSHDLRTPLSSIIASAGSLLQDDISWTEDERRDFAQAIEEEARRLNLLVRNLLDLSRIEAGSLQPDRSWYDLGALIDDVLGRLRPLTGGHKMVVDASEDLPPVFIDYVEIDAALSNLIENATKYAPSGTEVRIAARRLHDELEVEVLDNGPGIAVETLPLLFEPFYRSAAPGKRRGTGLGLAIARGIVEAHGGSIRAENRPEGGARFTFTLPLQRDGDAAGELGEST